MTPKRHFEINWPLVAYLSLSSTHSCINKNETTVDYYLFQIILNLLQVGKKPEKITYVGIHNRRTDYLEFRRKRLKLDNLYEDYFEDAMEYFREEYWDTTVVFVYVSDDMKWGRRNLKDSKNLFFLGNLQQKNDLLDNSHKLHFSQFSTYRYFICYQFSSMEVKLNQK